jgi:hypothetical protein
MPGKENIQAQVEGLATLLVLGDEIRKLANLREFAFFSTNETHRLISYHTAYLWQKKEFVGTTLVMQSGTAEIDLHAPSNQWIKFCINKISGSTSSDKIHQITSKEGELGELTGTWPEELPDYLLWCPFFNKPGELTGGLILFRDQLFSDGEIKMLSWLVSSYQYTWAALTKPAIASTWHKLKTKPHFIALSIIIVTIIFFPVHLSVLGTGTVIPKSPVLINSPMQGIIQSIAVDPGSPIKQGELLFSMDKTDLQASADVSEKDLLLTQTKLRAVIAEGFTNKDSNAEVPILQAQIAIDQAHFNYTNQLLAKADVTSPIQGVVIFDSKDDWMGQPVRTGEKILVVADPHLVALKINVPVTDMIKLEKGYEGSFFLYGHLNPLPVRINTLGYNAKLMPNRILGYQLQADFVVSSDTPQIGSQGTVKIYGQYVPLVYYLIRRPLQTMRQTLGI